MLGAGAGPGGYYDSDLSSIMRYALFIRLNSQFQPAGNRRAWRPTVHAPGREGRIPEGADLGKSFNDVKLWMPAALVDEVD